MAASFHVWLETQFIDTEMCMRECNLEKFLFRLQFSDVFTSIKHQHFSSNALPSIYFDEWEA